MTVLDADLDAEQSLSGYSHEADFFSASAVRLQVCLAIFGALMIWAVFFPFSGDGDSVLHYLNARETAGHWRQALYAWTRPGYKIPLSFFASHGILAAHGFNAIITAALAWNTMKLAEELAIPRAWLAGALLILQPFVFALGSDTMTELPMALGIVLAVRWWRNGKPVLACLMIGYLPSVRPEGFFFGLIFGVMLLFQFARARNARSGTTLARDLGRMSCRIACLSAGLVVWVLLCWWLAGEPLLVLKFWSWPPGSYSFYSTGTVFHYIINWPLYCGFPLFVLFLAGLQPSLNRAMRLPWIVWLTVIGVHTILYWRGWFASCGLIRIMACSSPITSIICLYGLNAITRRLQWRNRRPAGIAFATAAVLWAVGSYCMNRDRWHFLPLQRCARFVQQQHLLQAKPYTRAWYLDSSASANALMYSPAVGEKMLGAAWAMSYAVTRTMARTVPIEQPCQAFLESRHLLNQSPWFFTGDKIATAMLQGSSTSTLQVMNSPCNPDEIRVNLRSLPIGSIGIWDSEQAPVWHGHTIENLARHGFTVLYETHVHVFSWSALFKTGSLLDMRYAVLRKDADAL